MNNPFLIHNHTDASNFRLRDAINKPEDLLDYALELGLPGIAITDHATISNHVRAHRYIEENKDKFKDFTLGFGDEFYLLDKDTVQWARDNNEKIQYYHFLVLAKNQHGYEFLKKLTTREWENSFFHRGMERVPTYYEDLEELIKGYENDVIFTSACLGSPLSKLILNYHETNDKQDKKKIHEFITFFINLVGKDNFYLELQPAIKHDGSNADVKQEQQIVNNMLLQLCKVYDLTPIITTDAHYLNKDQALAHKTYLQASNGEREVDSFYSTTYVMDKDELLKYFDEELLDNLIENTHDLMNRLEPISFKQKTQVPNIDIPNYNDKNLFKDYLNEYEYINKFKTSERDMDRYYLHLIGEGMLSHNQEFNKEHLDRIEIELEQIWEISEGLGQPLSSYFVLTQDIIDMMWQVSLVGPARGSAACYYTNYLLDIVQFNPLDYDLPYYRFLSKERQSLPDIDIDAESSKREQIVDLARERYGTDKILNSCTFTTEGPKSTVITATRGYGLDVAEQHNIANLIPSEGAALWSVSDCFFGNEKKGRKPVKEFIDRVEKYDGLKDIMLSIEGLISGRSQHASSVIFYPHSFLNENAMMKTTKGLKVTQFNAEDGEYCGELKEDFLSISALGRIREAMDLLLEDGKIEWQGNLRKTFNKYFHPDVLDLKSKDMFKMLSKGEIFDAFQMSSLVARNAMRKIRPNTFDEVAITNTIIRLQTEGEQPIDKFVRYKQDINEWYQDMDKYGLTKHEQELMEKHLLPRTGICDTQEILMNIIIDPNIADGGLTFANKFRKSVGKKDEKKIENASKEFMKIMKENGQREEFARYILEEQFALQFSYAFSLPHVVAYTLVLMIEMNIAYKYGVGYWKTACLNINSGLEGDLTKGTDYTEVSKAVNSMRDSIILPNINKSQLKFTAQNGEVLYGLKPIIGLDTNTLDAIIENRPFKSLKDYYTRMIDTKLTSTKKTISLIKSGAMDHLEDMSRRQIMAELVKLEIPQKDKVTMVQLPYYRNIIPSEFDKLLELHDFRSKIKGKNKEPMNKDIEQEFIKKYSKNVDYKFTDELEIDIKSFEKYYNKEIKPLKEEIKKPVYAQEFTKKKRQEYWLKECQGSISEWEIDTILFNSDEFVVDTEQVSERHKITEFDDLKNLPFIRTNERGFKEYEISAITGVVVGYNNQKKLVYVLTKDSGVVTIKMSRKKYTHYQEKTEADDSWWLRGTKLVLLGYKNGEAFYVKGNQIYRKPVIKINGSKKYSYQNDKL